MTVNLAQWIDKRVNVTFNGDIVVKNVIIQHASYTTFDLNYPRLEWDFHRSFFASGSPSNVWGYPVNINWVITKIELNTESTKIDLENKINKLKKELENAEKDLEDIIKSKSKNVNRFD